MSDGGIHEFLSHDYLGVYIVVSVVLLTAIMGFAPVLMNFLDKLAGGKQNERHASKKRKLRNIDRRR